MAITKQVSFKPILTILGISAIITAVIMGTRQKLTPQPVGINEVTSDGTVELYASPTTIMIRPNVESQMNVSVVADTSKLTGVQLEVEYDPASLTMVKFENTGYLANTLVAPTIAQGVAKMTLGAALETGGVMGRGSLAKMTVKAVKSGTSTINFGPNTAAYVINRDTNSLKAVHSATVQALYPGDATGDNKVTLADYNQLVSTYGTSGPIGFSLTDLNNSGKIDLGDYNQLVANYGKTY